MGLDMYLYGSKYCSNWDHNDPKSNKPFHDIVKAIGMKDFKGCDGSPHLNVQVCLAYWRKANAIHKWFVNNVQGGKDDCYKHYVNIANLKDLKEVCELVLRHKDSGDQDKIIAEHLPPQDGFFFGSTVIDEYYWYDLEDTIKQIDSILDNENVKDYDFYYQSSW